MHNEEEQVVIMVSVEDFYSIMHHMRAICAILDGVLDDDENVVSPHLYLVKPELKGH